MVLNRLDAYGPEDRLWVYKLIRLNVFADQDGDLGATWMFDRTGVTQENTHHNEGNAYARRGGTISLIGLYGGMADPLPMLPLFDKQIKLRMGQANVKKWVDDIMPLLTGPGDPLGVESFATHRLPLEEAPRGYEIFQKREDGAIKVLLKP